MTKDATAKRSKTSIPREASLDAVRGLAALAIVWMHTLFWSGLSIPMPQELRLLSLLMDVPLFLVLAGIVVGQHKDASITLRGVLRLYGQYVLFMAFCYVGALVLHLNIPEGEPLKWLVFTFANPGVPAVVLNGAVWFIPAYMVSALIAVLLCPLKSVMRWGILAAAVLVITFARVNAEMEQGLSNLWTLFFCWTLVMLGIQLNTLRFSKKQLVFLTIAVIAALITFARIAGEWLPDLNTHKFPHDRVYLLYSLPSVLVLLWMRTLNIAPKFLVWVGRIAMPVFLAQGISGTLLLWIVPMTAFAPWPVQILVHFVFNVALALLLGAAFAKLWKHLTRAIAQLKPHA